MLHFCSGAAPPLPNSKVPCQGCESGVARVGRRAAHSHTVRPKHSTSHTHHKLAARRLAC